MILAKKISSKIELECLTDAARRKTGQAQSIINVFNVFKI